MGVRGLIVILAASLVLAACGSGGGDVIKPEPSTKNPMGESAARSNG